MSTVQGQHTSGSFGAVLTVTRRHPCGSQHPYGGLGTVLAAVTGHDPCVGSGFVSSVNGRHSMGV